MPASRNSNQIQRAIGRAVRPFVVAIVRFSSRVLKTQRVSIILENERGDILLVKNSIGLYEWELPGGGVGRGESLEVAAIRELREETGIDIPTGVLRYRGIRTLEGYDMHSFHGSVMSDQRIINRRWSIEIIEAKWFSPQVLPNVSPKTYEIINKIGS